MLLRSFVLAVFFTLVSAGCGTSSSVPDQAEDLGSLAAEGALLASDVSAGDSISPFAGTHAGALAENADELRQASSDPALRRVATEVVDALDRLTSSPGDRDVAEDVERRLRRAATRADEIGKRAS